MGFDIRVTRGVAMFQPDCMTTDELASWHAANARLTITDTSGRATPCWDCPIAWAAEQRLAGCCNGRPGAPIGPPRKPVTNHPMPASTRDRRAYDRQYRLANIEQVRARDRERGRARSRARTVAREMALAVRSGSGLNTPG